MLIMAWSWGGVGTYVEGTGHGNGAWKSEEHKAKLLGNTTPLATCGGDTVCVHQPRLPFPSDTRLDRTSQVLLQLGRTT